ncbi:MAG TPA: DUF983 domain-containing protein [Candidatus Binataceae bacterium]|nr:DUF983 domain-containing protein [Candidatus Binataceae bacterium]
MSKIDTILAILGALTVLAMLAALGIVLGLAMARDDGLAANEGRTTAERNPQIPGWTLLRRALAKRCPRCGQGRIFKSYFTMNRECPECGAMLWPESGEWIGAFVIDWTATSGAALVTWLAMSLVFPGAREAIVLAVVLLAVVASLLIIIPWSRSLWTIFLYMAGASGQIRLRPHPR